MWIWSQSINFESERFFPSILMWCWCLLLLMLLLAALLFNVLHDAYYYSIYRKCNLLVFMFHCLKWKWFKLVRSKHDSFISIAIRLMSLAYSILQIQINRIHHRAKASVVLDYLEIGNEKEMISRERYANEGNNITWSAHNRTTKLDSEWNENLVIYSNSQ